MRTGKPPPKSALVNGLLSRPRQLAAQIAKQLDHEDIGDISVALAMLTSGVLRSHADDSEGAKALLARIRQLEDNFIEMAFMSETQRLQ